MPIGRPLVALALLLSAAACAPGAAPTPSPSADGASAVREWHVAVDDGARLYVQAVGEGPDTLLVLHGGPGLGAASLLPDLLPLARGRVLVSYDQRGAGRSSTHRDPAMVLAPRHVSDVEAVRRHLGLERVALLGHSWGAGLAALYAMEHPGRVERLVLVSPMEPRREPYWSRSAERMGARLDSAAAARLEAAQQEVLSAADPAPACRRFHAAIVAALSADPASPAPLRGDPCAGTPEGIRAQPQVVRFAVGSLGSYDWREALGAVAAPALVVRGSADPNVDPEGAREWVRSLPDARLLEVEGSGHYPYAERPGRFFPAVDAFLRGRWPGGAVR